MFGRAQRQRKQSAPQLPVTQRRRIWRCEPLEERAVLSGLGLTSTPPSLVQSASVSGGALVSGTTASLSALANDAAGASKLVYNWSVTAAPAGGSATFSVNGSNAAQHTNLTFNEAGVYTVNVRIVDPSGLAVNSSVTIGVAPTFTSIKLTTQSSSTAVGASVQVASSSQSLVAQAVDQFGNAMATQPPFRWSNTALPTGASAPGLSASGVTETFTFNKAGSYTETVQATLSGITRSLQETLNVVSTPTTFTVSQSGGTASVTGTTAQFNVTGFQDQFNTTMTGSTRVTWAATTVPAGAAAPTFATSGTITTVTFKAAGQYKLTVTEADTAGHSINQTVNVTVVQTATGFRATSSSPLSVTGASQVLAPPTVVDQFGNAMTTQPALVWAATGVPSGASAPTFSTSGSTTTATFSSAGSYTLTAHLANSPSVMYAVTANVVQTFTSITVTSNSATVAAAGTLQFSAQALDQFHHAMATQPTFTWTASAGSITSGGLFTAPSSGSATIGARNGSITGSASVTVQQGGTLALQNANLSALVTSLDADGSFSRADMLQVFSTVEAAGALTASEFADLKTIINSASLLNMASYVQVLASDVVSGNVANATYLGQACGNLATGSSANQLTNLVGKWFLGTDLPTLNNSSYVYTSAAGSLFNGTPSHTDEYQGQLGDCYFISSLGTIADKNPAAIQNMFIDNGDGTFTVRFYYGNYGQSYNASTGTWSDGFTNGQGTADYVTVNRSLATTASGMLVYSDYGMNAHSTSNTLWIALAEKAYAQWDQTGHEGRNGQNSMASIEGGWMATVDAQVLGHNATDYSMSTSSAQQLINALAAGQSVTIGTTQSIYGLYGSHAYAVTGYNASSNTFTLYNPWGFSQPGQLTWAQLQTACSSFVTTDASGSTPISRVALRAEVPGDLASGSTAAVQSLASAVDQALAEIGNHLASAVTPSVTPVAAPSATVTISPVAPSAANPLTVNLAVSLNPVASAWLNAGGLGGSLSQALDGLSTSERVETTLDILDSLFAELGA